MRRGSLTNTPEASYSPSIPSQRRRRRRRPPAPGPDLPPQGALRVLVIDDERPALDELAYLLAAGPADRRGVLTASAPPRRCGCWTPRSRRGLPRHPDARPDRPRAGPGAGPLQPPPPVVFVTAHDEHAVDAFELRAVDYVLKPVRAERLAEAVRRVVEAAPRRRSPAPAPDDETIAVERGGVTRFVHRSEISYVEAQGDYARLHTADGSHLVRTPLDHPRGALGRRRLRADPPLALVALPHVEEVRIEGGRCWSALGDRAAGQPAPHPRAARPAGALGQPVQGRAPRTADEHRPRSASPRPGRRTPVPGTATPQRVRVTGPRMAAATRPADRPRRPGDRRADRLGEVYMRSLLRAQLRLGLSVLAVVLR